MRDGLHRGLALGREWQGLAKACERESERGATARDKASDALAADTKREVTDSYIDKMVKAAENGAALLPTFTVFGGHATEIEGRGSANTPLQNEISANAARLEAEGERGSSIVHRAVQEALKDRGQRRARQIEQHYEGGGPVARAASVAINSIDVAGITEALLAHKPLRPKRQRRHIDLDEDLTKPR